LSARHSPCMSPLRAASRSGCSSAMSA
jgi:hypothetical protein